MKTLTYFLAAYFTVLLAVFLFLLHQFVEPFVEAPLVDSYLDDLLFLPIAYGLLVFLFRLFIGPSFRLSYFMMLSGWLLSSLCTELLFPYLSPQHVGDPWDSVAYFIGGIIFHITTNKPLGDTPN